MVIAQLKNDIASFKDDNSDKVELLNENKELKNEMSTLKDENSDQQQLKNEICCLKKEVVTLENHKNDNIQQLADMHKELGNLKKEINRQYNQIVSLNVPLYFMRNLVAANGSFLSWNDFKSKYNIDDKFFFKWIC